MSFLSLPMIPPALQSALQRIEENTRTLLQVSTSRATVAQTPKQVIWTLNKARLYRYIPVVPAEQRHKVPLFLVFALMNRPYILDLRPGNSFIEYMVKQGYDVYLLDWGTPGPEDKGLKFDDYVLDYLPRAMRWVNDQAFDPDKIIDAFGNVPGELIDYGAKALKPVENYIGSYLTLWDHLDDPRIV